MAEPEHDFQEPHQRPSDPHERAIVDALARIVVHRIHVRLVPLLAAYLVRQGVTDGVPFDGSTEPAAVLHDLRHAVARFACSGQCPPILRYVFPGLQGELFAAEPPYLSPDRSEIHRRLEGDHAQHLASLADFGDQAEAVCRSIELCVLCLMPDPRDYPRPSPMAGALRMAAVLEADLRDLSEQSAKLTEVEKLTAFRERLRRLRWKQTYCNGNWRPPSPPLPPRRGIRIGPVNGNQPDDDDEPEPPPPDPAALERLAWEREAGKQWRDAHAVPWLEVVLPVVQSCSDVAELAQRHSAGEELMTLALTAHRELWTRSIGAPNAAANKALDGIEERMDLLWVRVTEAAKRLEDESRVLSPQSKDTPEQERVAARARKSARRAKGRTRSKGSAARPTPTAGPQPRAAGAAARPATAKVDPQVRVNYREALRGRPDLGLPRTAKTTLTSWCKNPQTAADLGVNPKGKVAAQEPLVSGLRRLHAQKSDKRRPPQLRPE